VGCQCAQRPRPRGSGTWWFCADWLTYDAAETECSSSFGGRLAITRDLDLNAWAAREAHGWVPGDEWWIGLRATGDVWSWSDGVELVDSAFRWDEPNTGPDTCAHLWREPGGWADWHCDTAMAFICEVP